MLAFSDVGLGIIVGGIAVVTVVALKLNRAFTAKLGSMQVTLESVDRAVNHRAPNDLTLSEEVGVMHSTVVTIQRTLDETVVGAESRLAVVEQLVSELLDRVVGLEHPPTKETP